MTGHKYSRILLKLSGEALMGDKQSGYDQASILQLCKEIKSINDSGTKICLVVGGGNILRGAHSQIERATADYMGMLATVMNAMALRSTFTSLGVDARVLSALEIEAMCDSYNHQKALRLFEKSKILIFAAGTGSPFFTTDSAATLRAIEMNCQAMLKATQVDGVYDKDPRLDSNAKKYKNITYQEVLEKDLKIMDATSIALAKEHKLPIIVFSMSEEGALKRVLEGNGDYTIIS